MTCSVNWIKATSHQSIRGALHAILTFPTRPRLKDLSARVLLLDLFVEISAVGHRVAARFVRREREREREIPAARPWPPSFSLSSLSEIDPQLRCRPRAGSKMWDADVQSGSEISVDTFLNRVNRIYIFLKVCEYSFVKRISDYSIN